MLPKFQDEVVSREIRRYQIRVNQVWHLPLVTLFHGSPPYSNRALALSERSSVALDAVASHWDRFSLSSQRSCCLSLSLCRRSAMYRCVQSSRVGRLSLTARL